MANQLILTTPWRVVPSVSNTTCPTGYYGVRESTRKRVAPAAGSNSAVKPQQKTMSKLFRVSTSTKYNHRWTVNSIIIIFRFPLRRDK